MTNVQLHQEAKMATTGNSTPQASAGSLRFIVGIVLMAGSFLVYPAYPVILLWLPISGGTKAAVSVAVWVLSWSAFSLGAYLAGPQGYEWFRGLWTRIIKNGRGLSR